MGSAGGPAEEKSMKRRGFLLLFILFGVVIIAALPILAFFHPMRTANPVFTNLPAVRAMRVDYLDEEAGRAEVAGLETQMQQAGVNLVAVGAGRVDWTYFPWRGYPDRWSADVKRSGRDYLLEDSTRFGKWAHVSAVVDVLAPLYIQAHPEAAAVSWAGAPSKDLVGLMELVDGQFGQEVLSMLAEIAAYYPVNSITLTELVYYTDGFGAADRAAYLAYTGRADWPRAANGAIDINDPSVGTWRAYEIGRFLEKAAAIAHRHNKQLFLEVNIDVDPSGQVLVENGPDLDRFLEYADRLVVRGRSDPDDRSQPSMDAMTQYLRRYPEKRIITGLGLWSQNYGPGTAKTRMSALSIGDFQSALRGVGKDLWITPSFLMTPAHWQALKDFWGSQPGR